MTATQVIEDLNRASNKAKSVILARFFKTGPGEYGEGDRFLGVTVPEQRVIAKKYRNLPLGEVEKLLISPWHEHRLTGLLILTYRFPVSEMAQKKEIFEFYLNHATYIDNWDLVDVTAPGIVGEYLVESGSDSGLLRRLAKSQSLWERRIAIVSTFTWIRRGRHQECFEIAEILLHDSHDLIQKAVGWMLREVGKAVCGTESCKRLSLTVTRERDAAHHAPIRHRAVSLRRCDRHIYGRSKKSQTALIFIHKSCFLAQNLL
jgi:3-methyladenine DNA glycosylase AlkD